MREYRTQNTEHRPNYHNRSVSANGLSVLTVCILSAVAISFIGCRPKGILHSGEMRAILVDLHKVDGMIQTEGLTYGHDDVTDLYYAQVLEKHGVTQAQFDSSIVWYTAHPVLFDKIYPKVKADLKKEHDAFKEQYAAELNLQPYAAEKDTVPGDTRAFTVVELDSMIWVMQHGCPSTWHPYPHPLLPVSFSR